MCAVERSNGHKSSNTKMEKEENDGQNDASQCIKIVWWFLLPFNCNRCKYVICFINWKTNVALLFREMKREKKNNSTWTEEFNRARYAWWYCNDRFVLYRPRTANRQIRWAERERAESSALAVARMHTNMLVITVRSF